MQRIQSLECYASKDDTAKETSAGGIFSEIKDYNINPSVLSWPKRVTCSGYLYALEKTLSHKQIWGSAVDLRLRTIFSKDEALMLLNKAAQEFLAVENREIVAYLQDRQYCLVAESFIRKEEGLIKRILLCKLRENYQHRVGAGIILA